MEKITITREFDAPVQLVWEAWTLSENISKWWGPKGYTTVVKAHDFKPGGRWEYVMVDDKDGKEFPAVGLFKDIIPFQKITSTEIADEAQMIHGISMPRVSLF